MASKAHKFICYVGRSNLSSFELDKIRCTFVNVGITLSNIYFGQICIFLLALIVIISIFGKFKENYRWFILNQAIWDILVSVFFIYNNYLKNIVIYYQIDGSFVYIESYAIIYDLLTFAPPELFYMVQVMMQNEPYSALFLLCFTRFSCLYFPNFYEKLTQKRRLFYLIIVFNLTSFSFYCNELFNYLRSQRENVVVDGFLENDYWYNFWGTLAVISSACNSLKPMICLLFSLLFTVMILFRVARQAKYQLQHNRHDFFISFRISMVLFFQTCLNCFVFAVNLLNFLQELALVGLLDIYLGDENVCPLDYFPCLTINLPLWVFGFFGLGDPTIIQVILQLRIFLESIIVLVLMTGYRESLISFFRIGYRTLIYLLTCKNHASVTPIP